MSPLYGHTYPADENDPDSEERKVLLGHYLSGDEDKGEFNGFALQKDCCCSSPGYWECQPQICAANLWRGFSPSSGARNAGVKYFVYVSESVSDFLADEGIELGGYEWLVGGQIWQITDFLGDGDLTREELGIEFPDYVQIQLVTDVADHTPSPFGEAGPLGSCRITGSPFQTPSASSFNSLTLGGIFGVVQTWHLGCQLLRLGIGAFEGGWSSFNAYPVSMSYTMARVTGKHLIQFQSTDTGGPVLREELVNLSHQHTRIANAFGVFQDSPLPPDTFYTGYNSTTPGNPPVTYPLYWPVFYSQGGAPQIEYCYSEKNFYYVTPSGPVAPTCIGTALFSTAQGVGPSYCKGLKDASRQTNPDPFDPVVWPDDFDCPVFFDEPCGLADAAVYRSGNRYDSNPTPGNVNPNPVQDGGDKASAMIAKMSPCQVLSGDWNYNPGNAMACCCDNPQGEGGGYNAAFLLIGDVSGNGCIERYPEPPIIPGQTFPSPDFPGGTTIFDEYVLPSYANEFIAISGGTLENS